MADEPWPIDEGSLAFALVRRLIRHQLDIGTLSPDDAVVILRGVLEGTGSDWKASARHTLARAFPEIPF